MKREATKSMTFPAKWEKVTHGHLGAQLDADETLSTGINHPTGASRRCRRTTVRGRRTRRGWSCSPRGWRSERCGERGPKEFFFVVAVCVFRVVLGKENQIAFKLLFAGWFFSALEGAWGRGFQVLFLVPWPRGR